MSGARANAERRERGGEWTWSFDEAGVYDVRDATYGDLSQQIEVYALKAPAAMDSDSDSCVSCFQMARYGTSRATRARSDACVPCVQMVR